MEEKQINPKESLLIINAMIDKAKNKLADDGFYFIFWGWLVTLSAITHYICLKNNIANGHWVWTILMPLGGLVSLFYGWRQSRSKKVVTYIEVYIGYLWGAVIMAMAITLIFMNWHGYKHSYFFLMLLYGIGSFVTGGLLNFRPLIFGSLFSFMFACLSVFLNDYEQLLCISGALLFSHIIPGHLLRSAFKSEYV